MEPSITKYISNLSLSKLLVNSHQKELEPEKLFYLQTPTSTIDIWSRKFKSISEIIYSPNEPNAKSHKWDSLARGSVLSQGVF